MHVRPPPPPVRTPMVIVIIEMMRYLQLKAKIGGPQNKDNDCYFVSELILTTQGNQHERNARVMTITVHTNLIS